MPENELQHETSPYLLQHKDNPVHWMAWGDAAFARAKAENKPILLSVGYAACHWCHVMAHESFEDEEISAVMNELVINIKVDREERPDIDTIYQSALAMIGEQGGWPLTIFLTPDGKPWGGAANTALRPAQISRRGESGRQNVQGRPRPRSEECRGAARRFGAKFHSDAGQRNIAGDHPTGRSTPYERNRHVPRRHQRRA